MEAVAGGNVSKVIVNTPAQQWAPKNRKQKLHGHLPHLPGLRGRVPIGTIGTQAGGRSHFLDQQLDHMRSPDRLHRSAVAPDGAVLVALEWSDTTRPCCDMLGHLGWWSERTKTVLLAERHRRTESHKHMHTKEEPRCQRGNILNSPSQWL